MPCGNVRLTPDIRIIYMWEALSWIESETHVCMLRSTVMWPELLLYTGKIHLDPS